MLIESAAVYRNMLTTNITIFNIQNHLLKCNQIISLGEIGDV